MIECKGSLALGTGCKACSRCFKGLEIDKTVAETSWAYVCGKLAALTGTYHEFALPHLRPEFESGFRELSEQRLEARYEKFMELGDTPAQAYALGFKHGVSKAMS